MSDDRDQYLLLGQKAQDDYDKTLVALSGGALAISFSFLDKAVPLSTATCLSLLLLAWICWACSLACILYSYATSASAFRHAVDELDKNENKTNQLGGPSDKLTGHLNLGGGLLFICGLVLMGWFVTANLGGK